jgi:hypothetical protein
MQSDTSRQLTAEDARQSLGSHVADKGLAIRETYGPEIGWSQLMHILEDRTFVRYPCEIVFDAEPLLEGEFAHPLQKGERPEDGFIIYVHPFFSVQPRRVAALVFYHLVVVNYGPFASAEDAETFGACALGLSKDEYYALLCEAADELVR